MSKSSPTTFRFNGENEFIEIGTAEQLGLINASFTVEAWVKIEKDNPYGLPLLGVMGGLVLMTRGRQIYLAFWGNDTIGNTVVEPNTWYHWAFRYDFDKQEQAIFVNGILDKAEGNHKPYTHNGPVTIGRGHGMRQHFGGQITDVRIWNHALSTPEIQTRMYHRLRGDEPGLRAYYPLNEGGGTTAFVTNTPKQTGLLQGGTWGSDPDFPLSGQVLHLNGKQQYVEVPGFREKDPDFSKGFAFEGWVKFEAFQRWSRIFDFGNGPEKNNLLLTNAGSSNRLEFHHYRSGGKATLIAKDLLKANTWIHLAVSINAKGVGSIFADGELIGEDPNFGLPDPVARTNCYFGRSNWRSDQYFKGSFSEFRLWNRPRTPSEVRLDYQRRMTGREAGLAGYWPLSGGPVNSVPDQLHYQTLPAPDQPDGKINGGLWTVAPDLPLPPSASASAAFRGGHIELPYIEKLDNTKHLTLEAWVKPAHNDKAPELQPIISHQGLNAGWELACSARGAAFSIHFDGSTKMEVAYPGPLLPGHWYHVAGIYDGQNMYLFVNAVLKAAKPANGVISGYKNPPTIGCNAHDKTKFFSGCLAEVKIWQRALTQGELQHNLRSPEVGNANLLIGYWPLDESSYLQEEGATVYMVANRVNSAWNGLIRQVLPVKDNPPLPYRAEFSEADYHSGVSSGIARLSDLSKKVTELENTRTNLESEIEKLKKALNEQVSGPSDVEEKLEQTVEKQKQLINSLNQQISELKLKKDIPVEQQGILIKNFILKVQNSIKEAQKVLAEARGGYQLKNVEMDLKVLPVQQGDGIKFPEALEDVSGEKLSTIHLTFSTGDALREIKTPQAEVPSLTNMTEALARRKLTELGLRVAVSSQVVQKDPNSRFSQVGRIVNQIPKAGVKVPLGAIVTIHIGKES